MRRAHDHQWVTDRIALGSAVTRPEHVRCLVSEGVTHVLDCRTLPPAEGLYEGTGIVHLQCGALDDGRRKPDDWFHRGVDFALQALRRRRARVLVHCALGMSRAPSMTYAVLRALDIPADEAESMIRSARVVASITYREDAERAVGGRKRGR